MEKAIGSMERKSYSELWWSSTLQTFQILSPVVKDKANFCGSRLHVMLARTCEAFEKGTDRSLSVALFVSIVHSRQDYYMIRTLDRHVMIVHKGLTSSYQSRATAL